MIDDDPIEPPDPFLAEHLDEDRNVPTFDPARVARLEARLRASIDAGDDGDDGDDGDGDPTGGASAPPTGGSRPASAPAGTRELGHVSGSAAMVAASGATNALVAGLLGLAVGATAGWFGHASMGPEEVRGGAPVRVVTVRSAPDAGMPSSEPVAAPAPAAETNASRDAGVLEVTTRRDAGRATSAARTEASFDRDAGPHRDDALADENALITQAQSALARGRTSEAMAALREHQQRFPAGRFTEEREALAVQALARMGNHDAAVARADRFFARYPNSLSTRAVRAAVAP